MAAAARMEPKKGLLTLLAVAGATLALLALLPLWVALAWVARFAVVALVPLAILAVVFSPALRRWLGATEDAFFSYRGIQLPTNRQTHAGHVWTLSTSPRKARVGIDALLARAFGPVETLDVAPVGTQVKTGDVLFRLARGDREVVVRAPVSGAVARINPQVLENPELTGTQPYHEGWVVDLKDTPRTAAPPTGREGWLRKEVDALLAMVQPSEGAAAFATDGGEVARDLWEQIDAQSWTAIRQTFFEV